MPIIWFPWIMEKMVREEEEDFNNAWNGINNNSENGLRSAVFCLKREYN